MSVLEQLSLTNFRNLSSITLDLHPHLNFIYGENGSGKSSLLEAIYITCQGQSFRTHNLSNCIKFNQKEFLLFARYSNYKVGISKAVSKSVTKINESVITKRSKLVKLTPIQIIDANSLSIISGSPKERRRFLDWGLFHVEQTYGELAAKFSYALKQRNSILKFKKNVDQLVYWNKYFIEYSEKISKLRNENIENINTQLAENLLPLVSDIKIKASYINGHQRFSNLEVAIKTNRTKDLKFGFSSSGSHRADFELLSESHVAKEVLSRGQEKRLALALILSQILILAEKTDKKIILLIDDLDAELDSTSINIIFELITKLNIQLFISRLTGEIPPELEDKQYKMFHVEHGMIRARKN